jgi:hypothetical protein
MDGCVTALRALAEVAGEWLRDAPQMGLSMGHLPGISGQLKLSAAHDTKHGGYTVRRGSSYGRVTP